MSRKVYKKVVSASLGTILAASPALTSTMAYAEETAGTTEETNKPEVTTTPETSGTEGTPTTPPASSESTETTPSTPSEAETPKEEAKQEAEFKLADEKGNPITNLEGIKFTLLNTDGSPIEGNLKKDQDKITFTPKSKVDDNTKFSYKIELPDFNEFTGDPISFSELRTTLPILILTSNKKPGADINFVVKDESLKLSHSDFKFTDKDGNDLTIDPVEGEETKFNLSKLKEGQIVKYTIEHQGYKKKTGEFTVKTTSEEEKVDLSKLEEVSVKESEINKVYGDKSFNLTEVLDVPSNYDGSISYSFEGTPDSVSLTDSSTINVLKHGEATVHITAPKTDNFEALDATVKINVAKKKLGKITSDYVKWNSTEKEYDGNDNFTLEGTLNEKSGVEANDHINVKVEFKSTSSSIGKHDTKGGKVEFSGDLENYSFESDFEKGPEVKVNQKELKMTVKDLTVSYGSKEWKKIKEGELPSKKLLKEIVAPSGAFANEEEEKYYNSIDLSDYFNYKIEKGKYKVGQNDAKISISLNKEKEKESNFKFVLEKEKSNVVVTKDERSAEDLWSKVAIDTDNSKNIYKDGETTFVKPGGSIAFDLKDHSEYNKVNIKASNLDSNSFDNKISIPASTPSKDIVGKFFLSTTDDTATKSDEFDIPSGFKVDADAPVVEFTSGSKIFASIFNAGTTKFSDTDEAIKFSKANGKDGYVLSLSSKDGESGLKSLKYSVVKITSDADAKQKIQEAALSDDTSWESVKNNAIAVGGTNEGYYIVIVKAKDNVGNEAVYASNGMVIDKTNPVVNIKGLPDLNKVQHKNVPYSVSLNDPVSNGVVTGIAKVDVIVKENGQVIKSESKNTNSFSLTTNDLYGVENLDTFSKLELAKLEKKFDGTIDADSNNITLEVVAYDNAGNRISSNEISGIKIDKSKASVKATYDNSELKNGKYLSSNRKLTVEFNDRNFVEDNATVDFTVDGKKQSYKISDIRDGKVNGIKLVSDRADSQGERLEKDYTNERTNTYVFEIGGEEKENHSYKVNVSYVKNGETVEATFTNPDGDNEFVIDKVAPETAIQFNSGSDKNIKVSDDPANPTYKNTNVTAILTVKEDNFDPKDVVVHVTSKDSTGKDEDKYSTTSIEAAKVGKWVTVGDVHTFVMDEFNSDSNYSLSFEYTDLAGNKQTTPTYYFTVDKVAPTGAILVGGVGGNGEYSKLSNKATFVHVGTGEITLNNRASDETSGVASVKYYLYHPEKDASGTFSIPSPSDLENIDWLDWKDTVTLSGDQQTVVYQRIEDKAGNVTFLNADGAILIDNTKPADPQINITTAASANNIYSGDVSSKIHVEDQVSGGTYSGLNTVTVEVLNGGNVTQYQTYNVGTKEGRTRTFDTDLVVDSRLNNSNYVTIRVTTVDWAGNTSSSERKLSIDTVAPRIEISWDSNDGRRGRYYNHNRTATVRVYERNFDPNSTHISVSGGNAQISGWSIGEQNGSSDENVSYATVTFSEDGDYTFSVSATDLAGNHSQQSYNDLFTIDKTVPTINVSWDKGLVNGKYVTGSRTATITVHEHNFDASGFTADVKAMLESQGIPAPSVSSWSSNGDTHTATLTFSADGDYSFNLNFEDMAGNKANSYSENEFTVDSTNPNIEFGGVADGSSNKGIVKPTVRFTDRNYDKAGITLKLRGYHHKEVVVTGTYVDTPQGGEIIMDDFPHDLDVDDIYTLTAEAVDKAGNRTTKSITFSVNRFGSNYYFSEQTKKYLDKYYHNKEQEIVIHEVNTDNLKNNDVTVTRDGSVIKLNKDDYTVKDVSKDGWKEYVYTIKPEVFAKEGVYEVTIDSEDAAGNKQSNKIKEKPASFVIDKTNPSSVITGIENGEIYNAVEREIGVSAKDNVLVGEVKLYVNGKVVKTYTQKEIEDAKGELKYTLKDSQEWQEVKVETTDAAGNQSISETQRVLVTADTTTRLMNSVWVKVFGLGGAGVIASSGLLWFLLGKKKKEESERLDDTQRRL